MEATDSIHSTANYFLVHMFESEYIDNILVSDTLDVTPTDATGTGTSTNTSTGIPGFPVEAILIGLFLSVLLVTIIRRRQTFSFGRAT